MTNEKVRDVLLLSAQRMMELADRIDRKGNTPLDKSDKGLVRLASFRAVQEFCEDLQTMYLKGTSSDDIAHSVDAFMGEWAV